MSERVPDARRRVWTVGDYPVIARHLLPISLDTVAALDVQRGERVLDVGVGTGNAAIAAARRGATVTGIDLTPAQIDLARARCAAEGVDVDLRVGDAESLDVPDASFDVVLSVMGVIFAPDHARAAAEMARVCRPGGRVAMTAWKREGWHEAWRTRASRLVPTPAGAGPGPEAWGEEREVARRLADVGLDATVTERPFAFRFPSVEEALDVLLSASGPFVQFMEVAASIGCRAEAVRQLRDALQESNEAVDDTCVLPSPYLVAVAHPRRLATG